MSQHLQRQIDRLKMMILELGTRTEEAVLQAIRAIETRDGELATRIIAADDQIDQMEIDVEEECLHTLALYQPVAFDLRFVVAVLKINSDLERIADLAVNIAQQAQALAAMTPLTPPPFDLAGMSQRVRSMLKNSLDSLVHIDPELADKVRTSDDQVDEIHRQAYLRVEEGCKANPANVEHLIHLLSVSRQLERIADHTVNIAEDVLYMARGDILRHGGHQTGGATS